MGIIQGKADPILDHAEAFPGTIGSRVQDAQEGHLVGDMRNS